MGVTTYAQKRSVVHQDAGGRATGSPDVCLTPPAPSPVPYVDVAYDRHTSRGSRTVFADGNPIMLKDSEFSESAGDEPGTAGGVTSGVNRGIARFSSYSFTVSAEGRNVARHLDSMLMNGDPPNVTGVYVNQVAAGEPWSLRCFLAWLCRTEPELVKKLSATDLVYLMRSPVVSRQTFDGASWVETGDPFDGMAREGLVILSLDQSCEESVVTAKHELTHLDQPAEMPSFDREVEAYTKAEDFAIQHGLPTQEASFSLRKVTPGGTVVDGDEVQRLVRKLYPVPKDVAIGDRKPVCIGYDEETKMVTMQDPVTKEPFSRPPQKGDSYHTGDVASSEAFQLTGEQLRCP